MHLLDNLVLMGVFFMLMRNLLTSLSYTSLLEVNLLGPAISKFFPEYLKNFLRILKTLERSHSFYEPSSIHNSFGENKQDEDY